MGPSYLRGVSRAIIGEALRRSPVAITVVQCELSVSSTVTKSPLAEATPDFKVDYHADYNLRVKHMAPLITPRLLPDKLSPPPLEKLLKKEDLPVSKVWTAATPCPSAWPFDCAIVQRNSNAPIEDRALVMPLRVEKSFVDEVDNPVVPGSGPASVTKSTSAKNTPAGKKEGQATWLLAGVFDGHGGWQTSEFVSRMLPQRLSEAISKSAGPTITAKSLTDLLRHCFCKVDAELRAAIEPAFNIGHCRVVRAGSTCCLIMATPSKLVAMNVGDSKAVLCRRGRAIELTRTQNAGNPEEAKKLAALHPNEPDIVFVKQPTPKTEDGCKEDKNTQPATSPICAALNYMKCMMSLWPFSGGSAEPPAAYVKARLQPTRSFGDFDLKDSKFAVYWGEGRTAIKPPHTHPYITAEPEVTVIPRDLNYDEFVIVATDGLWDEYSPAEAVAEVKRALNSGKTLLEAAQTLEHGVLAKVAAHENKTVDEMLQMSPKDRRKLYDDVTVTLVSLKKSVVTKK